MAYTYIMLDYHNSPGYNSIMLVSHESPISILEESKTYNDYDYALVHLFETQPDYYNFFKRSLAAGREVLLDNSIFELGESFDPKKYIKYITDLNPSFYIVPDVLENAQGTMSDWKKFFLNYGDDLKGRTAIGVVQGNTYQELVDCISLCQIMLTILLSLLTINGMKRLLQLIGAVAKECLIVGLLVVSILSLVLLMMEYGTPESRIIYLGAALAREFATYAPVASELNIRSLDTSNPVVAGLLGHRYMANQGLNHKPSRCLLI